jgi:two-component system sensor histidine kinase KdpD
MTLRILAGIGIVAALTFLGYRVVPINATTQGFVYLIAILFLATGWGLAEAIVASVVAVLCFNYFFFQPVGTFTIEDPQNWVALFAFLVTAVTASRLSDRAKRRAIEVLAKQEEMERLYTLSRAMLLIDATQPVAKQVATQIAVAFQAPAVVVYSRAENAYHRAGREEFPGMDDQLRDAALQGTQFHGNRIWITAIRLGGEPIGSIGISGVDLSDSALQSLANLAAIGMERARAQEAQTNAEAARQSDELKSMLLDAIAHEFQTPLTAIKAASSALLSPRPLSQADRADLLQVVNDETQHVSSLVSDAIQMARIEAGKVHLERQSIAANQLIGGVLREKHAMLEERVVAVDLPDDLPMLWVDPDLVAVALRQLLDNAAKFSQPDTAIEISARSTDGNVTLAVRDYGQGIAETELPHVFEKFYRGRQSRSAVPGAGLGLAVVRAVVESHQGKIGVESAPGKGATFRMTLPAREENR